MLGTTTWSQDLTTAQKRNICQNALIINRQKGTIGAIKRALKTLSLGASVVEWFEDAEERDPLTAKIILQENEIIYSEEQYKQIMALVDEVKRLSVHVTFVKQSALRTNQYVGIAMRITTRTTYHQRGPRSKEIKL
jgi:P2-related tail formation protein